MLPKENRLKRDKDFQKVFKGGAGAYGSFCGAKFSPNGRKSSRIAVVVGTKVSKSAVVRNRIRRQIREVVRLNLAKIRPGYDLVIIAKPEAKGRTQRELEQATLKLIKKTPLL